MHMYIFILYDISHYEQRQSSRNLGVLDVTSSRDLRITRACSVSEGEARPKLRP